MAPCAFELSSQAQRASFTAMNAASSATAHGQLGAELGARAQPRGPNQSMNSCRPFTLSANTSVERTFFHSRSAALKKRRSPLR